MAQRESSGGGASAKHRITTLGSEPQRIKSEVGVVAAVVVLQGVGDPPSDLFRSRAIVARSVVIDATTR